MPLIPCPECSKQISDKAISCPQCGFPINSKIEYDHSNMESVLETPDTSKTEIVNSISTKYNGKAKSKKNNIGEIITSILFSIVEKTSTAKIICPYCKKGGYVNMKSVIRKSGIHGGKATAGVFTGGLSLLVTGLSGKQRVSEYKCCNCNAKWTT
jgi:DNA-directed RNA polymerase subunit RPC12/RpoP